MDPRIEQLREHLEQEPTSRRFFQLGELLRKYGQLQEAIDVLTTGLDVHPRYVAAWVSLGRAQAESELWAEAEASFAKALQIDPENAVAARLIGEIAEATGEHERAIKAFQLAQALTPGDSGLVEAIERNEAILRGQTTAPMAPVEAVEEPFADPSPFDADQNEDDDASDDGPFAPPRWRRQPPQPVELPADDPFSIASSSDSGVWELSDDVFMTPEAAAEVARVLELEEIEQVSAPPEQTESADEGPFSEQVSVVESVEADSAEATDVPTSELQTSEAPIPEPEIPEAADVEGVYPEEAEQLEVEPWEPEVAGLDAVEVDQADEMEGAAAAEAIPAPPDEAEDAAAMQLDEGLPVPTVTLARLAADQGDLELARRTLQNVLDRDPDNTDARDLLRSLVEPAPVEVEVAPPPDDEPFSGEAALRAKISTLKAWVEAVRLAAERRET